MLDVHQGVRRGMTPYLACQLLLAILVILAMSGPVNLFQNTEIVYIVSGSEDFSTNSRYRKNMKEIIEATSSQLDPRDTRAGVLFAWDGQYVELVSQITTIPAMEHNLEISFGAELGLERGEETESSGAVAYARDKIFSKEDKHVNQLVIILIPSNLGNHYINEYLQDICTKIITFVVVQPIGKQTCALSSVRKRLDYLSMLLNYTKLLTQKQALCFEDMTKVVAVNVRKVVQTAIDTNNDVKKYCDQNPHLRRLKDTGLLCAGFFCEANPILWISIGAAVFSAALLVIVLMAFKVCRRHRASPDTLDYYSFLAPALAYHNKFIMAQSICLYGSRVFQGAPPTKMKKTKKTIFQSTQTSGATTKTQSRSDSPKNEKPRRLYQKAPARVRILENAPKNSESAPSSRRASEGVNAPAAETPRSSAASSRRASKAGVGNQKLARRKSSQSLWARPRQSLEGSEKQKGSLKSLQQCSADLSNVPAAAQSKQKMGGVKKNIKRSLTAREQSVDDDA